MAYQWNSSRPSRQLMIQIMSVREVSIVARWAAEATFVVVIPHTLKQAIDAIMPIDNQIMALLFAIYSNA